MRDFKLQEKTNEDLKEMQSCTIGNNFKYNFMRLVSIIGENPYLDYDVICDKIGGFLPHLIDRNTLSKINSLSKGNIDILRIRGLPRFINSLIDTPSDDKRPLKKDYISEFLMLGISGLLRTMPKVNIGEKDGSIIQQVIPIKDKENEMSGSGSKKTFDLHTENIHEINPPVFFVLYCLRGDKNASTTYVPVNKIIDDLPLRVVRELKKPNYIAMTGPSYTDQEVINTSILKQRLDGTYEINFNLNPQRMKGRLPEHEEILNVFRHHVEGVKKEEVVLEEGDCLIINNRRVLHGRTSFEISTSFFKRRWLQRLYLYK